MVCTAPDTVMHMFSYPRDRLQYFYDPDMIAMGRLDTLDAGNILVILSFFESYRRREFPLRKCCGCGVDILHSDCPAETRIILVPLEGDETYNPFPHLVFFCDICIQKSEDIKVISAIQNLSKRLDVFFGYRTKMKARIINISKP